MLISIVILAAGLVLAFLVTSGILLAVMSSKKLVKWYLKYIMKVMEMIATVDDEVTDEETIQGIHALKG